MAAVGPVRSYCRCLDEQVTGAEMRACAAQVAMDKLIALPERHVSVGGDCHHDDMIMQPIDVSWLCGEYGEECYGFIYLRTTPEQAIARLGGHYADFEPARLPDEPDDWPRPGEPLGVASVGDWSIIFYPDWIGIEEKLITRLSEGTRLVFHTALGVEDTDDFYWCEDGEIKYLYGGDDAFVMDPPDELADAMEEIDKLYPSIPRFYRGPAFLLIEYLTGIRPTEELLKSLTFRWGTVKRSGSDGGLIP